MTKLVEKGFFLFITAFPTDVMETEESSQIKQEPDPTW